MRDRLIPLADILNEWMEEHYPELLRHGGTAIVTGDKGDAMVSFGLAALGLSNETDTLSFSFGDRSKFNPSPFMSDRDGT